VVPRGELAAHAASCPFEPVGCAMARHGCGWRGSRRGLAAHAGSCSMAFGSWVGMVAEVKQLLLVRARPAASGVHRGGARERSGARPARGRLSALGVSHRKSGLYGGFCVGAQGT
jgi:hypothetical protein